MQKALWFFIGIFLFFSISVASSWAQWGRTDPGSKDNEVNININIPEPGEVNININIPGDIVVSDTSPVIVNPGPKILTPTGGRAYIEPDTGRFYPPEIPAVPKILTPRPGGGAVDQFGKFYPHAGPRRYLDPETGNIIMK